jgi:4-hydroxy-2-oxoheptanedioate aldolase
MPNRMKQAWSRGETVVGGWLQIPSGYAAEVMCKAGYDTLTVDLQHGVQDYHSLVACFQAMTPHGPVPLARVPWNEPGFIGKALDAGAMGIICPMVNTPQEAKAFVAAMRYPPLGSRSHGPIRAGVYGEAGSYYKTANDDIICMPMIETEQAVRNIDAILDVPGIDAVYIGPGDLGLSMGLPPALDREEPEILKHYETVLRACQIRGVFAGIHNGTAAYALRMSAMGFRYVVLSSDAAVMLRAATADVQQVKAEAEGNEH